MAHNLKDVDLEIVKHLYNLKANQTITTYSLAQKIFCFEGSGNKIRFYTDKANYIDYRMIKLKDAGIINIEKLNKKNLYTLILNNVKMKLKKVMAEEIKLKINGEWESFVRKI